MPNKRPSSQWTEPEEITLVSGATVTVLSGATVTLTGGQATVTPSGSVTVTPLSGATVTLSGALAGNPTTAPIALYPSGNATIFVATNTFKVTHFNLAVDEAMDIKLLSGTDYLAGNASVAMSIAAEGQINRDGTVDSPVYVASGSAKGFVINSGATGEVAGSITWLDS